MLTLTENAATIVRQMTDAPDVPATAGLRITEAPEGFAVSATPHPTDGDQAVQQDGAIVYLDAASADRLEAMVLDAGIDESGTLQFELAPQH